MLISYGDPMNSGVTHGGTLLMVGERKLGRHAWRHEFVAGFAGETGENRKGDTVVFK
jgi:ATP-dependent protease HslVU (ClpYQ) peptidase subunit